MLGLKSLIYFSISMKKKILTNQPQPNGGSVIVFKGTDKSPKLEVRLEKESVWLTQKQMAELFEKTIPTINEHIKAIFREGELKKPATIRNFRIVQIENGRQVTRDIEFYNLDIIISVGYRVKSLRGTQFRIWATRILREHIVQGYTINQKRLDEQHARVLDLQKAVEFLREKARRPGLSGQAEELLSVIQDYAGSLSLFYHYDAGTLTLRKNKKPRVALTYELAQKVITEMKLALTEKNEASDLFGQEYGEKLHSILGALYQTFGRKELYGTVEEKAANLLYLMIKDHPLVDGNKRIGSLLFVYFLECNHYLRRKTGERKISDTTLVALALLVAESDPKEKDTMIKLITNLLT